MTVRRKSNQKGSQLERDVAVQLSLWWSYGASDTLFWRTAGSGARATNRGKKGKTTSNSAGDIGFIDDAGKDLLQILTFELKRGYPEAELQRFVDAPTGARNAVADWLEQAKLSAKNAGTPFYAVICKKDRRDTIIHLPLKFYHDIGNDCEVPAVLLQEPRTAVVRCAAEEDMIIVSMPFHNWLEMDLTRQTVVRHLDYLESLDKNGQI